MLYALWQTLFTALANVGNSKDDISKANSLIDFYNQDKENQFFVTTFKFNSNMTINIEKCVVPPIAWIPDIYINPSNNGNLPDLCRMPLTVIYQSIFSIVVSVNVRQISSFTFL